MEPQTGKGSSWPWSYGSWIYNYAYAIGVYNHWCCEFESRSLCDKVCQWLATGRWFSPGPPVSSTNKTDRHDITEILFKVALNTKTKPNQTNQTDNVMSVVVLDMNSYCLNKPNKIHDECHWRMRKHVFS